MGQAAQGSSHNLAEPLLLWEYRGALTTQPIQPLNLELTLLQHP
jgi:hypothetical protein